tara:strand:+ start:431 stop:724 length:294 start_codon:yes stop_codon:yes gene_type:complete
MSESSNEKSINETLDVIRKALQEEVKQDEKNDDILVLNNLVKNDGTIAQLSNKNLNNNDVDHIIKKKLSKILDEYFKNWMSDNIPQYLDKYFSKKEK